MIMGINSKTVLITGSTDGVGRRVAERIGAMGAHVILHGRDRTRGEATAAAIRAAGNPNVEFHRADLSSLAEVRQLAGDVSRAHRRLDILINNAGVGSGGPRGVRETSADGYELRFAVNYLAGFLLTMLLLPTLRASAPARIVHVASAGQSAIDFDDVMLTRRYDGGRAYTQSKLAQVMFTFDLARELEGSNVTVNCLHPATYMDTTMVRESGVSPLSSVEEGADAILQLAVSPELEGRSGLYFQGRRQAQAHPQAYDDDARRRLAAVSFELTGLSRTTGHTGQPTGSER
jgi:NAD(P)-dependent dehydrogenase (short-subunit alcohol dehydrogenase family)